MIEAEESATKKERHAVFDRISGKKPCLASCYDGESGPENFYKYVSRSLQFKTNVRVA